MGGDGGVIASNRRYLRGAGTADHTADSARGADQVEDRDVLRTCHVTQSPLNLQQSIVACPYGRLYQKEAAVEALLRRSQNSSTDTLGSHIRGLKDLYPVRFQLSEDKTAPVCPVTGVELNDKHPCFLIVSNKTSEDPNVLSERAKKEMGMEALQAEYGPFHDSEDLLRLAPNANLLEEIQKKLKLKREMEKSAKKSKKDRKKRKKSLTQGDSIKRLKSNGSGGGRVAEAARARVATAVASNEVLSSLFATSRPAISEKEKNDNLFARS